MGEHNISHSCISRQQFFRNALSNEIAYIKQFFTKKKLKILIPCDKDDCEDYNLNIETIIARSYLEKKINGLIYTPGHIIGATLHFQ